MRGRLPRLGNWLTWVACGPVQIWRLTLLRSSARMKPSISPAGSASASVVGMFGQDGSNGTSATVT